MTFLGRRVGVELEYFVVDRDTLEPLDVFDALAGLSWAPTNLKREIGATQIEIATPPFGSVVELARWLVRAHVELADRLDALGTRLLPLALYDTVDHTVCDDERTRALTSVFGPALHENAPIIAADQVNVGTDERRALLALEALRRVLPELLALGAASPLAGGAANGVACNRIAVIEATAAAHPSLIGYPVRFRSFEEHRQAVASLPVLRTPNGYYKWVRPMPHRGVAAEVRCTDKQPTLSQTLAFAALCHGLAGTASETTSLIDDVDDRELRARFEAARHDGLTATPRATAMIDDARRGLEADEERLLEPLAHTARCGLSPADALAHLAAVKGLDGAYRAVADGFEADLDQLVGAYA